jgi:hypothetical protein
MKTMFSRGRSQTAEAIAEGRFEDVDLAQSADEISDVGKSEQRALASQIERIRLHLLEIRFEPDRHGGSWELSIAAGREHIQQTLRRNPSLRAMLPEAGKLTESRGFERPSQLALR